MVKVSKDAVTKRRATDKVNQANTQLLIKSLPRMTAHQMADLIIDNADALETYISTAGINLDIDTALDTVRESKDKELVKQTQQALTPILARFVKDKGYSNLYLQNMRLAFQDAEQVAKRTIKRQEENADNVRKANSSLLSGVYGIGKTLGLAAKAPLVLGHASFTGIKSSADILEGISRRMMGRKTWATIVAGAVGATGIYATASADLPNEFPHLMNSGASVAFNSACTPDVIQSRNPAIASFAVNFNSKVKPEYYHAYLTSMNAVKHEVPPQALYLISFMETNGFRDVIANNSSASNSFQFIDDAKLGYIKQYGDETSIYKQAKENLQNNAASPNEKLIVLAIDTIQGMKTHEMREMLKDQTMIAPVYEGLRLADTSSMAAELVSLDLLRQDPSIADASLTPKQILNKTAIYYAQHHFLGHKNYTMMVQQSERNNNVSLYVAQPKLQNVILKNPGLLTKDMSAKEALQAIKDKFIKRVEAPYHAFVKAYQPGQSVMDYCAPDIEQKTPGALTMPRYQAAALTYQMAYQQWAPSIIKTALQTGFDAVKASPTDTLAAQEEPIVLNEFMPGKHVPVPVLRPAQ